MIADTVTRRTARVATPATRSPQMLQCTTHHHACDCREAEFASLREAAQAWFAMKRPLLWSHSEHLQWPSVNCTSDEEVALAKAVAKLTPNT